MRKYSLEQVKQNLPEILQLIEDKKLLAKGELWLYQCLIQECIWESTHERKEPSAWTNAAFMAETWKNYKRYSLEVTYLKSLIKQLENNPAVLNS